MATKPGGGNKQENYDPNTGKYVASDVGDSGLNQYHTGSGLSKQDIINRISNGDFGQEIKDIYDNGDNEEKEDLIEYINSEFDKANTQSKLNERYEPMSINEYNQWQRNVINNSTVSPDDLRYVGHYTGTGKTSFYLNTAMRFGYDEMLRQFIQNEGYDPNEVPGDWLSRDEVRKFSESMERVTHSVQAPRNMRVDRYVGTGPLVSWFKNTGVLDGLKIENNGWHDKLVSGTYDLDDLANRLSNLIGSVLPRDGSYMSFSACPDLSHMKNKSGMQKKDILMKIDVPKGQDFHLTDNHYESEGMFPKDIDLYLKDVKVETDNQGKKRIVMYYGIKK